MIQLSKIFLFLETTIYHGYSLSKRFTQHDIAEGNINNWGFA